MVRLKTLTLHYGEDWFAKDGDCLPLNRSILALPQLQTFHLHVYDMRHLPPWLGELRAFASLSVNVAHVDQKPFDPAPLRTLQALELLTVFQLEPTVLATILHALPPLTSLQSNRFMNMPESNKGGYQAGALLLRPGLRRLHLSAPELPPLPWPQAQLADMWLRVSRQASLQRDLFAFTPVLKHLHLELFRTYSLPDFHRLPAGLASLTLKTGVRWPADDGECAVDIRHLSALQKLHLSCEVTVSCACHADERTPWMEEYANHSYCCRFFKRYRQYGGDVHLCRFMPLDMARQLFPDAGLLSLPPAGPEAPLPRSAAAQPDGDAGMVTLPQARQQEEDDEAEEQQQEEEGKGTPEHAGVPPPRRLETAGAPATSATRGPVNRCDEVASWRMLVEDLQARAEVASGESVRAHAEAVDSLEFAQSIVRTLKGESPRAPASACARAGGGRRRHGGARGRPCERGGEREGDSWGAQAGAAEAPASAAPPGSAAAERQPEGAGSWRWRQRQQPCQERGEGGGTARACQRGMQAWLAAGCPLHLVFS
eukprot:jgi/Mesen1/3503/ME000197S02521